MTVSPTKRRAPTTRTYTQADLDAAREEGIRTGKVDQREHDARGEQQTARSALQIAARAGTGAPIDVPGWLKVCGALAAFTLATLGILGLVWNFLIALINMRLAPLETARTEQSAAMSVLATRAVSAETKLVELNTTFTTATRIRDQQQQATTDRLRGLEQSDQSAGERLAQLAQTIASILPRLEEILRRQERLENRLSGPMPRPGMDEAPAIYAPHPSHI